MNVESQPKISQTYMDMRQLHQTKGNVGQSPLSAALLIIALLAGLQATAHAQTSVSLYTGTSFTHRSDLQIQMPSTASDAIFRHVSWAARPFAQAPYYGYRLTHYFENSSHLGFSLDYTHYKIYARTGRIVPVEGIWNGVQVNESAPLSRRVQDFNISHGVNMITANVLYRWRRQSASAVREGRLQPYVGSGLIFYVPHSESTINNRSTSGRYQTSGFGYQALAGVQYGLIKRISIFVEAKFNIGTAKVDTAEQGRAETKLRTLHTLAGISYRF